jgi:hypothetical protein
MGKDILLVEAATVKVFLHMGDYHIPLAHEDSAPRHEFHVYDKGQIVQTGTGDFTAVNLHGIKQGHRR